MDQPARTTIAPHGAPTASGQADDRRCPERHLKPLAEAGQVAGGRIGQEADGRSRGSRVAARERRARFGHGIQERRPHAADPMLAKPCRAHGAREGGPERREQPRTALGPWERGRVGRYAGDCRAGDAVARAYSGGRTRALNVSSRYRTARATRTKAPTMNRMASMAWSDIMVPCSPIMPSLAPSSCSWRTRGFLEVQVTKFKLAPLEDPRGVAARLHPAWLPSR